MDVFSTLILILGSVPDGVRGKTAIQKIAYFLSVILDIDMNFFAHYYGPYSKDVAATLDALSDFDFVDETRVFTRNNRFMHVFTLNEDGRAISQDIIRENQEEYELINKIIKNIEPYGQNYEILSWAAKIYYILNENGRPLTEGEVISLAENHNWDLTDHEIDSAKKILLSLGIVKMK